MANRDGHRRFGNIRKRESGRYQIRYPGPDGQMRSGTETYERKSDAERALSLIEAQIIRGEWTDPDRGKIKFKEYAETWISQRPGLRPRTVDLYRWLLKKHIAPYLGNAAVGKISTAMVRQWRADLLGSGVSVSVAAKAYRLLRAVLMTAVEEDHIISRNPCRIRGAGDEHAQERPVLTVAQVFELADLVGRRPVGNVRKLKDNAYRLRFQRHGEMRTHPEVFTGRADAERALWKMGTDGRADRTHDRRFRVLVLLATFASLRWGEVSALRRTDVDLDAGTVRIRAAYVERSTGGLVLGPPKSKAGRRVVGIPKDIVSALREHIATYVQDEPGALLFPGAKGGPLRRSGFNTRTRWVDVVKEMGMPGLHFHDLRHTGNMLAAESGAGLKDLMARMGHDNVRAAMIYQHAVRGADKAITDAIDRQLEKRNDGDTHEMPAG
ncbi:tyrosine-type recombinase/integrase [Streptosporangium sp. NBC_01756]|uniref:tyrosine-type recombinase/integrase n=1 Tax=Streptosporangium sp. NBC_01756 TaxID=2975950 RepID=UPI002DD8143F|nr:site-specific integrase [Streptosporangium sp. NBC_01756]WSC83292.1 site-specific integrase [Streptosporangium sp. NBC_01756]